jgi:Zn-finger nucleic acid-binding protein
MSTIEPTLMALVSVNVATCATCGGRWFPADELAKVDEVVEVTVIEIRRVPDVAAQRVPLACPQCPDHPPLEKAQHARDAAVVIDACRHCRGIWLDRGELEAIRQESLPLVLANLFRWLRQN